MDSLDLDGLGLMKYPLMDLASLIERVRADGQSVQEPAPAV